MKNVRVFLSSLAVIVAIGAAYATQFAAVPGQYEFIPAGGGEPARCKAVTENCNSQATQACQVNMHDVRDDNGQTSCGQLLKRPS